MAVPTLPLYLLVGVSGAIAFVGMILSFHLLQLKTESLLLSFVGIYSILVAATPKIWSLLTDVEAAAEVLYGLNIAVGALLFFGMIGASKILENDVESLLLGYIATLTLCVAAVTELVKIVGGVV